MPTNVSFRCAERPCAANPFQRALTYVPRANPTRSVAWSVAATIAWALTCTAASAADYAKDIAPLWKRSCVACHNSKKAEGGLNLETAQRLLKGSDSGQAVFAGKSAESELLKRILATDDSAMPPKDNSAGATPLTPAEIELVKQWIDAGAVPGEDAMLETIAWQPVPSNFQPIYAVDASIDGQFVATGRGNQVIVHNWPLQANATTAIALVDPQTVSNGSLPSAHLDLVQSVAFSPDAGTLATGGYRCVKIWKRDLAPTALVGLKTCTGVVASSNNGQLLAVAREDKTIDIVEFSTRQSLMKIPAAAAAITSIQWSFDDTTVFALDAGNSVTSWQLPPAGSPAGTAPKAVTFAAGAPVTAIAALAPDRVALQLADGQLQLFVAAAGEGGAVAFTKKEFAEAIPPATAIAAISGDPIRLLAAQADGTIRAIHALEGKVIGSWKSPVPVTKLAVHPKAPQVASLGSDGSVRLWNVADGKELTQLIPETSIARDVARSQRAVARQTAEVDRLAAVIKELEAASQKEQGSSQESDRGARQSDRGLDRQGHEYDANTQGIKDAEAGIEAAKAMIAEQMKRIETLTLISKPRRRKNLSCWLRRMRRWKAFKSKNKRWQQPPIRPPALPKPYLRKQP